MACHNRKPSSFFNIKNMENGSQSCCLEVSYSIKITDVGLLWEPQINLFGLVVASLTNTPCMRSSFCRQLFLGGQSQWLPLAPDWPGPTERELPSLCVHMPKLKQLSLFWLWLTCSPISGPIMVCDEMVLLSGFEHELWLPGLESWLGHFLN